MPKKLILDIDNATWKEVLKYKIDYGLRNNNEAAVQLIKRGLTGRGAKHEQKEP